MSQALYVVKIGGNVIDNPEACARFLSDFAKLDAPKILVHGGGKVATQIAAKLQIETQMVEGRRITDKAMLDVVTMVYGGLVNKNLVAQLQALNCNAIGLTGADGGIIRSVKRPVKTIDYGFVGDIEAVNAAQVNALLSSGLIPVIAPLTYSSEGLLLNTNADTMASATAVAMAELFEVNLIFCFEKKGVLSDPDDDNAVIASLNPASYADYKSSGVINKGMIPKLDGAFEALKDGVKQVTICHSDDLLEAVMSAAGTVIAL
ncbi:acetylglutamate kinase [Dyadobacter chenwenxiniae]|uniref:Acetylglutamate kinase n=1 Tax=Dyadobacter chenwenxiniae TaxID=2906456 RepID=A0A9X1TET5_9BACT|nr:acetylglutamate kinase [Dyadobacter chenwenxiniae]MCF0049381.1 acetylglutamate kinase [Dyadobacter chenwenxiniae]MCF0061855.1 acetylglutamate kinase [Dyadobacter chenwenxiniae]UON81670.1 acetylglutamate kinase [Dyadobacter chenwenxiniae]